MNDIRADRMRSMQPSQTGALTELANKLKAEGKPVIILTVGEPDFKTPKFIRDAGKKAIDAGPKYTNTTGTPDLKDAISAKFKRDNDLDYKRNEIIVSNGGKQVLFNAFGATLNKGDEVIIPAPYWVSYPEMVSFFDGKPVTVPCDESQNFKITPDQLENAITPKTKWLTLNSPSNPTGAIYSADELKSLAEVLRQHPRVHIISDDIYEHLRFNGQPFATMAQVAPDLKKQTVTVNGMSKGYAMTGWRIGFGAGPQGIIEDMGIIQGHCSTSASSITQAAAVTALNGPQDVIYKMRDKYQKRRDKIVPQINNTPGLSVALPDGAFYLFVSCKDMLGRETPQGETLHTDIDVCRYFLESQHVGVVPGTAFGAPGFFRASYAAKDKDLVEACKRIKKAASMVMAG